MQKFLIERSIPGIQHMPEADRKQVWAKSNAVLAELDGVQWAHSYVTDDKIYCVYFAPDEGLVREHARKAGLPADRVSAVRNMLMDDGVHEPQEVHAVA